MLAFVILCNKWVKQFMIAASKPKESWFLILIAFPL